VRIEFIPFHFVTLSRRILERILDAVDLVSELEELVSQPVAIGPDRREMPGKSIAKVGPVKRLCGVPPSGGRRRRTLILHLLPHSSTRISERWLSLRWMFDCFLGLRNRANEYHEFTKMYA